MNKEKSEVILVLDRSGSMSSIKSDIEGGLKAFLKEQKAQSGECYISLYQFDTEFETVFQVRDIQSIDDIIINPRGGTALLDAIGRSSNMVGERLAVTPEDERPGTVMFLILSDGEENSSREFNKTAIKNIIQHQTDVYKWSFTFLGANQDAITNGTDMGFSSNTSLTFGTGSSAVTGAFNLFSSGVACSRNALFSGTTYNYSFTEAERKLAMGE